MVSIGPKGRYFVISIQQVCDVPTGGTMSALGEDRKSPVALVKVTRLTHFGRGHSRTSAHNRAI